MNGSIKERNCYKKLLSALDRKSCIEYVGPFGTGKTTFLKRFFEINKDKYMVIEFSSHEFDFTNCPKEVFVGDILIQIARLFKNKNLDKLKKLFEFTSRLLKGTLDNLLLSKGIKIGKLKDEEWRNKIKTFELEKDKLIKVKNAFLEVTKEFDKNLVLLIDDLDRCRPDFALEIIEISKHILNPGNMSVIFVYNRKTIDSTIKKSYGETSGERYLEKFIDETIVHDDYDILPDLRESFYLIFKSIILSNNKTVREINKKLEITNFLETNQKMRKTKFMNFRKEKYYAGLGFWYGISFINPDFLVHKIEQKNRENTLISGNWLAASTPEEYSNYFKITYKYQTDIIGIIDKIIGSKHYKSSQYLSIPIDFRTLIAQNLYCAEFLGALEDVEKHWLH